MHVFLAVFFLVSSVVSHCRCVFAWVACICANDRLLRLSRGGRHRHSFFCFSAHARRRQDKQYRTSSLAGAQGRPGQLLQAASISFTVEQLRLAGSKWTP